ncbi:MAG: hypothetical protein ACREJR_05155 [Candidatus Rokuibacteriota bacterium]
MRRAIATAVVLLGLGGVIGGCGLSDPHEEEAPQGDEPATASGPADSSKGAGEELMSAKEPEDVVAPSGGRGGASPAQVVSLYARAYANWTWRDVARKNGSVLARVTAGGLHEAVRANARDLRADTTLERDQQSNRGEQLALDVQGTDPDRRTVWVVLRETASAKGFTGLSDTRTTVYRATAERLDDSRWYVTAFEPAS